MYLSVYICVLDNYICHNYSIYGYHERCECVRLLYQDCISTGNTLITQLNKPTIRVDSACPAVLAYEL